LQAAAPAEQPPVQAAQADPLSMRIPSVEQEPLHEALQAAAPAAQALAHPAANACVEEQTAIATTARVT
jgi:hypothetical protein